MADSHLVSCHTLVLTDAKRLKSGRRHTKRELYDNVAGTVKYEKRKYANETKPEAGAQEKRAAGEEQHSHLETADHARARGARARHAVCCTAPAQQHTRISRRPPLARASCTVPAQQCTPSSSREAAAHRTRRAGGRRIGNRPDCYSGGGTAAVHAAAAAPAVHPCVRVCSGREHSTAKGTGLRRLAAETAAGCKTPARQDSPTSPLRRGEGRNR